MIKLQQVLLLILALGIAGVMIMLGLWQMQVFEDQGDADAEQRAGQPAQPLTAVAQAGQQSQDGYGRTVTFSGRYLPDQQFLIPVADEPGHYRVLTALLRADGTVVPVVRGESSTASPPPPPSGEVAEQGLFLASEAIVNQSPPPGELGSVRLSEIVQVWKQPMVPGFVTLTEADSRAQGLTQAAVTLPAGDGHFRNGGYALQWWIFAGFGLVMAVKIVRTMSTPPDLDEPLDADESLDPPRTLVRQED